MSLLHLLIMSFSILLIKCDSGKNTVGKGIDKVTDQRSEISRLMGKIRSIKTAQRLRSHQTETPELELEDGGWSDWGIWSACSVTCGNGIRERNRTCTNPPPSWLFGRQCEGNSIMVGSCGYSRCLDCSPSDVQLYDGTWDHGESGPNCQRWDSQTPHQHQYNKTSMFLKDESVTAAQNYCRDPDNSDFLWCYTTDPNKRWEKCSVPFC